MLQRVAVAVVNQGALSTSARGGSSGSASDARASRTAGLHRSLGQRCRYQAADTPCYSRTLCPLHLGSEGDSLTL